MPAMNSNFEWTNTAIARLRQLWSEGLSTAEIGRRLGTSKNSVVGKAHRLDDLPARGNPIKRDEQKRCHQPKRIRPDRRHHTLPMLQSMQETQKVGIPPPQCGAVPPQAQPAASPLRTSSVPLQPSQRRQPCCWPVGEPGTPGFRYCDEHSVPDKPYCAAHCHLAYQRATSPADHVNCWAATDQ